jgi:hypothetical protein
MYGMVHFRKLVKYVVGECLPLRASSAMPTRRLDDRIRTLSTRIEHTANGEVDAVLHELLAAIHEKLERMRTRAANQFLHGKNLKERRALPP